MRLNYLKIITDMFMDIWYLGFKIKEKWEIWKLVSNFYEVNLFIGEKILNFEGESLNYTGEIDTQGKACGNGKVSNDSQEVIGTFLNDLPHGICTRFEHGWVDCNGEIRNNDWHGNVAKRWMMGMDLRMNVYFCRNKIEICVFSKKTNMLWFQDASHENIAPCYRNNQLTDPWFILLLYQGNAKQFTMQIMN